MSKFIILSASVAIAAILGLSGAYSQTPDVEPAAKIENVDLVKGLTVTGTLKQVIGDFGSHGTPRIGDTFELDLDALPKDKIQLTPLKQDEVSYMPFHAPMAITRVKQAKEKSGSRRAVIELSAVDDHGKLVIRIMADDLATDSKVRVIFYRPADQFLGSMAEAEGVIK